MERITILNEHDVDLIKKSVEIIDKKVAVLMERLEDESDIERLKSISNAMVNIKNVMKMKDFI